MSAPAQSPATMNVAENVPSDSTGIVFLHLRLAADGTFTLLDTQTRPGILKAGDADAHGITVHCQIVSSSGAVLWTARVADPSSRKIEWEDPTRKGRLLSKIVETPGAEFMVRVPRFGKQQRVEFRRPTAASATQTGTVVKQDKTADRVLGAFDLTLP